MKKQQNNKIAIITKIHSVLTAIIEKLHILLPFLLFTQYIGFIKKNPYLRLVRLDKLAGVWLVLLPALWSIVLGASHWVIAVYFSIIFTIASILIRGAGCIINDIFDQKFDAKVERTKTRPLASDELNKTQALVLLSIILIACFAILLTLPVPAIKVGIIAILLIAVYPLTKRFMRAPQLFLGITFNIGVLIGWFAVGNVTIGIAPIFLYIASIFWTIGYDTIYAMQDRVYDEKLGISSTALLFKENSKKFTWKIYRMYALLLFILGIYMHLNIFFFIIMSLAAYHSYWQVRTLDDKNPADCLFKFQSNVINGLLVFVALLLGIL